MSKFTLKVIFIALFISLIAVRTAWAGPYIDPNTGGMLFQMLAVAFGIISGLVLLFASQIKMLFARISRSLREKRGVQKSRATAEQE